MAILNVKRSANNYTHGLLLRCYSNVTIQKQKTSGPKTARFQFSQQVNYKLCKYQTKPAPTAKAT
jgi:hypothetical protein